MKHFFLSITINLGDDAMGKEWRLREREGGQRRGSEKGRRREVARGRGAALRTRHVAIFTYFTLIRTCTLP